MEMGPGEVGLSRAYILRGGRAVARAAPDRSHRPLPVAQGRPGRPRCEETLGAFTDADRPGQGPGDRGLELLGRPARRGAAGQQGQRPRRPTSASSRITTWPSGPCSRPSSRTVCLEAGPRRDPVLLARRRVPHGQVPLRGRPGAEPPGRRRSRKYLNERGFGILKALDEVAGRLGSTPARVALAWLAARPEHHRADRQRDQRRATGRPDRRRDPRTRRRGRSRPSWTRPAPR